CNKLSTLKESSVVICKKQSHSVTTSRKLFGLESIALYLFEASQRNTSEFTTF
ncbi:MAG: hypothetical protein MHPSP_001357, partial [Paramarteilia canceri]